jgi:hypothetical protein
MKCPLYSILILFALSSRIFGWSEMRYQDSELVSRAECIVIGHVKPGSLKMAWWDGNHEVNGILVVSKILKGDGTVHELPFVIGGGLMAVPKRFVNDQAYDEPRTPYVYDFKEPIVLFDANPDPGPFKDIDDIRQDQVWLLRRTPDIAANQRHPNALRAEEPQDVEPLSKENDLKHYLPSG